MKVDSKKSSGYIAVSMAVALGAAIIHSPSAAAAGPECVVVAPAGDAVSGVVDLVAETSGTADGVVFHAGGEEIGFGFMRGDDASTFDYAAYGTLNQGWASASVPNGQVGISCLAWGEGGRGELGSATDVAVENTVFAELVSPVDGLEVRGDVPLTLRLTAETSAELPATADFTVDGEPFGTTDCEPVGVGVAECTLTWDSRTANDIDWDVGGGLRVIGADADGATPHPVRTFVNNGGTGSTLLLADYELSGLGRVGRDGGLSHPLPGDPDTSFFTFGDGVFRPITGPAKAEFTVGRFGNTNTLTPVRTDAIGLLSDFPNPSDAPYAEPAISPILGSPDLLTPDGTPCPDGGVSWSTGIVDKPNSDNMLLTYWPMCVYEDWFHVQQFGIAEWDMETNTVTQYDVFSTPGEDLESTYHLSSPVIEGDYMYLYRAEPEGTWVTRVPVVPTDGVAEPWKQAKFYEWKSDTSPTGWSNDADDRTSVTDVRSWNTAVAVNHYPTLPGEPYLMILAPEMNLISIMEADHPEGPWTPVEGYQDYLVCDQCEVQTYTYYGHPEFSTADEIQLTYTDSAMGRVVQTRLPWVTAEPTPEPSPEPSTDPSPGPSPDPSPDPSLDPSPDPSPKPGAQPGLPSTGS